MSEQTPYGSEEDIKFEIIEFAENPEPRCPCILLLDGSYSMKCNNAIGELNKGIKQFKKQLAGDEVASKRVEVSVIRFASDIEIMNDFETADRFDPIELDAYGATSMGAAIETAVQMLEDRKRTYKENGISYYRPWIFMITDGEPTDDVSRAIDLIEKGERKKQFAFFAVGIQNANMEALAEISQREPLYLNGLNFTGLFQWLSNSMSSVSHSSPEAEILLESPSGWAKL
ncbi:MAG: VWA domain-containing protein [Cyanobacteria bacterium RUI128]|nr:VWA domain-containing protein [Cyanobacteria bacterium RUI128]